MGNYKLFLSTFLFYTLISCSNQNTKNDSKEFNRIHIDRRDGRMAFEHDLVSSDTSAVRIADLVLVNLFGKEIDSEKPYNVDLYKDSIWIIRGNRPNKDLKIRGGLAYIEIRKKDGCILKVFHEQ